MISNIASLYALIFLIPYDSKACLTNFLSCPMYVAMQWSMDKNCIQLGFYYKNSIGMA